VRGRLHLYRDAFYEKAMSFVIPILVKIGFTPNQITILRLLIFIPPSAYLFSVNNYLGNVVAVIFFHLFAFFDIIDGKIAVQRGMCTRLGEIIDPPIDYIGHNLVFIGITVGAIASKPTFELGTLSLSIPIEILVACGILTIIGFSVPLIFSMIPPTRFFMFKDLHDLNQNFFPENKIKSSDEPLKNWLTKNIICPYNFPFNLIFKVGPLLTLFTLLSFPFFSLIIFSFALNIRVLALFYYYFTKYDNKPFN
jgi:hypothetical protein